MILIFKSFFYLILLLTVVLTYIFFTSSGNRYLYDYLSHSFSQKTDLDVKVNAIDLRHFPKVIATMNVEHKANLIAVGKVGFTTLELDYSFTSASISYDRAHIHDDLHIVGQVSGQYDNMYITGRGTILEGTIVYATTKKTDSIENLVMSMKGVSSHKLFKLMGQETLINGKADVEVDVAFMNETDKQGTFTYDVTDNNFSGIPLHLRTKVTIDDMRHRFITDIDSPFLSLQVTEGTYDQEQKLAKASYTLAVKDLAELETLLGYKYLGEFNATGEIHYDKHLCITGTSKTYGGVLDYIFEKNGLIIGMQDVSFKSFISIFPYEPILNATTSGNIFYNFIKKTVIVNAKLKNAKLLKSKFTKNIYQKSRVKMTKETFINAKLDAGYHDGVFSAEVKLGDGQNHAYLTNAIINTHTNTIKTYFNFMLQGKSFSGHVNGTYDDPNVDLNVKEALEYQVNHTFKSIIGKKNKENMQKVVNAIPLGNAAKDIFSDSAASFVKMLF